MKKNKITIKTFKKFLNTEFVAKALGYTYIGLRGRLIREGSLTDEEYETLKHKVVAVIDKLKEYNIGK